MSEITSYEIKEALARKHRTEFFMTECKNGPTGVREGRLLQFDAVALYKSWSQPEIRGYEIKVSRGDFLRDAKYPCYLPYFHEFYFVVPKGLIKKEEIGEEGVGLMYYDPETGAITTKKRAIHRSVELDANFLMYIIMSRLDSDRAPFMLHKGEVFRAWLSEKERNRDLAYKVKSKLLSDNACLEKEVRDLQMLKDADAELGRIKTALRKHGVRLCSWDIEDTIDKALGAGYHPELDSIRDEAQRVVAAVDRLIFSLKKKEDGADESKTDTV